MPPLVLIGAAIGILMFLGAGIALLSGGGRGEVGNRLEEFVGGEATSSIRLANQKTAKAPNQDMADRLDKAMSNRGMFAATRTRIAMADVKLRMSEYIILQWLCLAGGGVAFYFWVGPWLIPVGALVGFFVPRIYINMAANRRIRAFDNQLSDTLNLLVNALRSGYSILQSMEAVATELPPPVSKEFERVVQEIRLGLGVGQALANMLRRVPSEDLDLVVTAINIQREVGGNLAEVLDIISFTIRERVRIKGEIRTLTAQGRLTGLIISLLPLGLGAVLYTINPEYGGQLIIKERPFVLEPVLPCGWVVIGLGLLMMFFGVMAIRKIVDIEV